MIGFLFVSFLVVALSVAILAARDIRCGTPAKLADFPKVARLKRAA